MSNTRLIAAAEAASALKGHEAEPVEARLRIAMSETYRHWMATDETDQFVAAVAAVIGLSEGEERDRLEAEMDNLRAVSAAMTGVPVDFGALQSMASPVGLLRLWDEVKRAAS